MDENTLRLLAKRARGMKALPYPQFPPSAYYRFLRLLAEAMRPSLSVELGLCGGGGSLHLALGWYGGTVVGVEISDGDAQQRENWRFIKRLRDNFELWKGDSVESAPEIAKEWGQTDLLFVDTDHTYRQTMAEWNAWEPYLSERAVVCLDDLFRPGMEDAWNEIPWTNKLRLDYLHDGAEFGGGFGVVWR